MRLWLAERGRGAGPLLMAMVFMVLLGLTLGLAAPHSVDQQTLDRARLAVGNYIQALPEANIVPAQEFQQALLLNGGLMLAIGLAGLHLLGLPLIVALLFLKGLSLGYAVSFLLDYQGASAFIIIFLSMLPQNLLLLPLFVLSAYVAARASLSLICTRPILAAWALYGLRFALLLTLTVLAALIQGYLSPWLLRMFFVLI